MTTAACDIIERPIITEQSTAGAEAKEYTSEVAKNTGRIEITKAVEGTFGVKATKANTLSMQGKGKRTGRFPANRHLSWKRAMTTLIEGLRTIEFLEGMI